MFFFHFFCLFVFLLIFIPVFFKVLNKKRLLKVLQLLVLLLLAGQTWEWAPASLTHCKTAKCQTHHLHRHFLKHSHTQKKRQFFWTLKRRNVYFHYYSLFLINVLSMIIKSSGVSWLKLMVIQLGCQSQLIVSNPSARARKIFFPLACNISLMWLTNKSALSFFSLLSTAGYLVISNHRPYTDTSGSFIL